MSLLSFEKSTDAYVDGYSLFQTNRTGYCVRFVDNKLNFVLVFERKRPYALYMTYNDKVRQLWRVKR